MRSDGVTDYILRARPWATCPADDITLATIGEGWSSDPAAKAREIEAQERLVSEMAELTDLIDEWELDG